MEEQQKQNPSPQRQQTRRSSNNNNNSSNNETKSTASSARSKVTSNAISAPLLPPSRPKPIALHQASGVPFGHVPAYLPGSASLVEELDKKIMIVLRDGKHIVGYNNLILQDAVERRIVRTDDNNDSNSVTTFYCDIPLGMYIVRGDSMVLTGQLRDTNNNNNTLPPNLQMKRVSLHELEDLEKTAKEPLVWEFDLDLIA